MTPVPPMSVSRPAAPIVQRVAEQHVPTQKPGPTHTPVAIPAAPRTPVPPIAVRLSGQPQSVVSLNPPIAPTAPVQPPQLPPPPRANVPAAPKHAVAPRAAPDAPSTPERANRTTTPVAPVSGHVRMSESPAAPKANVTPRPTPVAPKTERTAVTHAEKAPKHEVPPPVRPKPTEAPGVMPAAGPAPFRFEFPGDVSAPLMDLDKMVHRDAVETYHAPWMD